MPKSLTKMNRCSDEIDRIINHSPHSTFLDEKLTKFQELFNKEDSYTTFLVISWKLSAITAQFKMLKKDFDYLAHKLSRLEMIEALRKAVNLTEGSK
ncbi:hypothetical protein [Candidiatus Paracoxiella cheracis]|uniref:hypothetical protein n=1 Tax=Candidiatus Paracoxiella cheracis TaxID=3405120 RepID=UPI003BF48D39